MTTKASALPIHPVLQELGLLLPLQLETSWELTPLSDDGGVPACRICLAADRDLIIEVADGVAAALRFVFDQNGHLVSVSHSRHLEGAPFDALRSVVLAMIGQRCLVGDQ